jgi:hypothetical protein
MKSAVFWFFNTGALIDECDTALMNAAGGGFIASVPPRMSTVEPFTSCTGIFLPMNTDHRCNSSDSTNTQEVIGSTQGATNCQWYCCTLKQYQ